MDCEFPSLPGRTLRLDNGVQVALLHDAAASRAAVAAGVAVGSFHEPPRWPGLAHFLEHGLFLGSAAHPGVAAFADYVHGCGGRYNARTLGLQTLYYLEVPARELAPALGRLVDLLGRPLLMEDRLAAEREVLEAEYRARCADGDCQLHGALAGLLQPEHPLARFHAGNRASLDGNDAQLFADLRAWHARHYRGGNLRLLLSGPQSLDELEQLARELGGALPAGEPPAAASWPALWPAGQGARELTLEQPQALQRMSLWLPLAVAAQDEDELLALLGEAASQPAAGGLLAELRSRGWAQQVAIDWLPGGGGEGLLGLRLERPATGAAPPPVVAALCVDWLRRLATDPALAPGEVEWRALCRERAWQEAELAPMERAGLWLARWLRQGEGILPVGRPPRAPAALLAALAGLQLSRLIVQDARTALDDGAPTPWFPVRRRVRPLLLPPPEGVLWQPAPANPFLAASAPPAPAAEHPGLRPGQAALLLLWQPPGLDAGTRLAAELAEAALAGHWQQALHGAARLGHVWQALPRPGWLRGCLSGPAASLPAVLEGLLTGLAQSEPAQWRADLQRQRAQVAQQMLLRRLLAHPAAQWREADELAELPLDGLDDGELRRLVEAFVAGAARQALPFGPLPAGVAAGFARPRQAPPHESLIRPGGERHLQLELGGDEHAVLLRVLAAPDQPQREAAWRLLAVLQQGAFYQALRVEQGLGYALFSRFQAGEEGAELQFGVQSPHADGARLQQAIREFLARFAASLATLDEDRLAQARQAALDGLLGPDNRRARLLRACSDWLGGREAGNEAAVRAALTGLSRADLQQAAADLAQAEWRWLVSG